MANLKLMCVMAHPDDETLGTGGILAKYAAEGIETYLVTATRGQRGWFGAPDENPGEAELGRIREGELHAAGEVLGLREITLLDYMDGELDQADFDRVTGEIVAEIRRVRPHVVVTFEPFGAYGHPDHIAISQITTAAMVAAASPDYHNAALDDNTPHQVSKLYYTVETHDNLAAYQTAFGDLVMEIDGAERSATPWADWAITTRVPCAGLWQTVWEAISCHRSQLPGYESLKTLPEATLAAIWEEQTFYRAYSLVNGGREIETDMFAGLRESIGEMER